MDEQATKVGVSASSNFAEPRFAAAALLAWGDAETGGELTSVFVVAGVAHGRDQGICRERANAGAALQAFDHRVGLRLAGDVFVAFGNTGVEGLELAEHALDHGLERRRGAAAVGLGDEHLGQGAAKVVRPKFGDDGEFGQATADAVEPLSLIHN